MHTLSNVVQLCGNFYEKSTAETVGSIGQNVEINNYFHFFYTYGYDSYLNIDPRDTPNLDQYLTKFIDDQVTQQGWEYCDDRTGEDRNIELNCE